MRKDNDADKLYLHTTNVQTNHVIYLEKQRQGKHDTDHTQITPTDGIKRDVWIVDLDLLARLVSTKNNWSLKYDLFRVNQNGKTIRFEIPTKRGQLKLVLPLLPLRDHLATKEDFTLAIHEAEVEIRHLSLEYSTPRTRLVPIWVLLNDLNPLLEDEINRINFQTTMEMLLRGAYDQVWVFGDRLTPGMKAIIRYGRAIQIKIVGKTTIMKKLLAEFYES